MRRRLARRLAERSGWQVLERRFYSPVPDLDELPEDVFERRNEMRGIDLDPARQIAFAESELAPHLAEFGQGPEGFPIRNEYYETGDAEIAYAFVRHIRPRRIVELGSGFSTLVLAHAAERNRADGAPCRLVSFDPYPPPVLADGAPGLEAHTALPAQEVPEEEFAALESGDLLFVDTSHTVKLGGDVNRIVLDVLPALAPGVWVHFHDIWLPYEYHRTLVREMEMYWNEQYLLQAFLAMNPSWEVVFATRAVAVAEDDRLRALIPEYDGSNFPSSFWMRRTEP